MIKLLKTILFSALSDKFRTLGKTELSSQLFKNVMTKYAKEKGIKVTDLSEDVKASFVKKQKIKLLS